MATTREPRRVRRARRRVAFHANRVRLADGPAERMRAAELALLSAITHAALPGRAAREVADDAAEHARALLARPDLDPAARRLCQLHEEKFARAATDVARAGVALPWLRAAIGQLPEVEWDALYEHYTNDLTREARAINGRS